MEQEDRQKIQRNFVNLIENTVNFDGLVDKLVEKSVIPNHFVPRYMNQEESLRDRKRKLFFDIPKRGPRAFKNFVSALCETGHWELAKHLDPEIDIPGSPTSNGVYPFQVPLDQDAEKLKELMSFNPGASTINIGVEPFPIKVKKSLKFYDIVPYTNKRIYPTRSIRRGRLLIINNIDFITKERRRGADVDERSLQSLFEQCGFVVETHRNLSTKQMENVIINFRNNRVLSKVDIAMVVVMSHGGEKCNQTVILGSDEQTIETSWVIQQFTNTNCEYLQNRPKIFVFQICRGQSKDFVIRSSGDEPVQRQTETDGHINTANAYLRREEDILVAYATLPGYTSHRDIHLGSWFVQALCLKFMDHAHDTPVHDLFMMVDEVLRTAMSEYSTMQTVHIENRGFSVCYLHPGLHE